MGMLNTAQATDAELKVLDDAELDAVTGGQNRNIVGLVNLGVGANALNVNLLGVQTNVAQGQSTGDFNITFGG